MCDDNGNGIIETVHLVTNGNGNGVIINGFNVIKWGYYELFFPLPLPSPIAIAVSHHVNSPIGLH